MFASPSIGPDGTIYIGSMSRHFYAISPQGDEKWKFNTRDWVISSACVGADGAIYVGSYNHSLYVFQDDGKLLWKFKTGKFVFSSPSFSSDGSLLVGSDDGTLYALRADSGGLAASAWPKFRANSLNSGSRTTLDQDR